MDQVITLHWVDITIICTYLAAMILVGVYHSGKQDSLQDFFLARKGMSWIPVGISLMAALNSGMDYINMPSVVINYGWIMALQTISWVIVYPYVFYLILPMFRRLDVMSAYEFLELRFGGGVRILTAVIFMLWRLGWMATALYVPCLALTTAIGRPEYLIWMIIIVGVIVTFYTMMGGIKAVIWNDVAQFMIMMLGLLITTVIVLNKVEGGAGAIFSNIMQEGVGNIPNADIDSSTLFGRVMSYLSIPIVLPTIILMWLVRLVGFTSDQVMIQRFATAKTIRHARMSFTITAVADSVWMLALFFVGLALSTYLMSGGSVPQWVYDNPDHIFPFFMAKVFPIGVTGFVLAAILAASLSSIDSALNSMTTVGMIDFYNRLILKRSRNEIPDDPAEQRRQVLLSRCVTIGVGILGITLSCFARNFGTLFHIANSLLGTFMGPMLAIFWLGMFSKRCNSFSAITGGIIGTSLALFLAFIGPIADCGWGAAAITAMLGENGLYVMKSIGATSSAWIAPVGLFSTLLFGLMFGSAKGTEKAERWNWFGIIKMPLREN